MTRDSPLVVVALVLSGCATMLPGDVPRIVHAFPLPSYQMHEECFPLEVGERIEFQFESDEPVDFNLHYSEGGAVVIPVSREKSVEAAGMYVVRIAQDYCLTWEAGAAGAVLDYRYRVRLQP